MAAITRKTLLVMVALILAGSVSAEELDRATRHLEECAACAESLDGLLKHDTLMEVARSQTAVDVDPEADAVRGLIDRIRGLRTLRADKRHDRR